MNNEELFAGRMVMIDALQKEIIEKQHQDSEKWKYWIDGTREQIQDIIKSIKDLGVIAIQPKSNIIIDDKTYTASDTLFLMESDLSSNNFNVFCNVNSRGIQNVGILAKDQITNFDIISLSDVDINIIETAEELKGSKYVEYFFPDETLVDPEYIIETNVWANLYMNTADSNEIHMNNSFDNSGIYKLSKDELREENLKQIRCILHDSRFATTNPLDWLPQILPKEYDYSIAEVATSTEPSLDSEAKDMEQAAESQSKGQSEREVGKDR